MPPFLHKHFLRTCRENILSSAISHEELSRLSQLVNGSDEDIDLEKIPLDNAEVYEYFQEGLSEDVFHFGTHGSMGLSKDLKPESIHELH